MSKLISQVASNPLIRFNGQHQTAKSILNNAFNQYNLSVEHRPILDPVSKVPQIAYPHAHPEGADHIDTDKTSIDYTYIDPGLDIEKPLFPDHVQPPRLGLGYAGFTPKQRHLFLSWLRQPHRRAPEAFLRLYLAYLEINLFESKESRALAHDTAVNLQSTTIWRENESLARTLLLSYWLNQDGLGLTTWLAGGQIPTSLLSLTIGLQMILQKPITVDELTVLITDWGNKAGNTDLGSPTQEDATVWASRLSFLNAELGVELLSYVSQQMSPEEIQPKPWRCAHRDIRIALPQPDVQPILAPLLTDLLTMQDIEKKIEGEIKVTAPVENSSRGAKKLGWHLVLEFGHSRSEYFETALHRAKQLSGFSQLMDENRKLVYRIVFKNGQMHRFWPLWEFVKSWSHTTVYINGSIVDKREIYLYSPRLNK